MKYKKRKGQNMFYIDVPRHGEYKPFVTKSKRLEIIEEHLAKSGKKPLTKQERKKLLGY